MTTYLDWIILGVATGCCLAVIKGLVTRDNALASRGLALLFLAALARFIA